MDNLTYLVQKFEEAEQASQQGRRDAEQARDYKDGRQYTSTEIKALKKRKQPIVTENLIRPKVDYLCGLERQSRTDPKAYPRTQQHDQDALAVTDALRYVADDQLIDIKRSHVFENMLVEGFGGVEVIVHRTKGGIDPKVVHIAWDRLFVDPHASDVDYSDAMYMGFVTWMDSSEAKTKWQGKDVIIDQTVTKSTSSPSDTYDDKPRWAHWADSKRGRVRIVTMYCKKAGQWNRVVFTLAGELEEMAPSPFLDEDGNPECGLLLQAAYIDRDNDSYGIVRDLISLQDEVNKRRSKFLHLSNSRQIRIGRTLTGDANSIRAEMTRPDGVIVADEGEIEVIGTGDMAAGHFNLLAEAKQAIQLSGPNATMQGKEGQGQSGRAILALQQGGMTEMAPLLDNLRHFNIRLYRMIWNRIRQFWTETRWIPVTDDEKNMRFVGLNITKGDSAVMKLRDAVKSGEIDEQTAAQYVQQIQIDPSMYQPVNEIAQMDVDIQIEESVDTPSLQIEQFEQLAKLAPMTPPQHMMTMWKLMIDASNLRDKDKLRKTIEEAESKPDPSQGMQQQISVADAQAQIEKTQSEAARNLASADSMAAKTQIDAFTAGYGMAY